MSLTPGSRLGPYEILAPIGAGGMGVVYSARDTRLDRTVAIKVLPEHLSASPEVRARFEREARAVSSLNHPHICVLHDVGHQDGIDYLVMEHLEGETLAARLERGPLPTQELLRVATQIADALDKAHRQGMVHRDLKPGNVMLTRAGAKLLDFGLARTTGLGASITDLSRSPTMSRSLTAEGTIVGTFQYMAPEMLEGREADARSDIFAFGAMLHEMATGQRAFDGKSQASVIAAILERDPPPISTLQPLAPPALERLVKQCLVKDPDQRRQSMHDVLLELQWVAEGGSQAGVPAHVAARRRGSTRVAWLAAGVFAAAAVALAIGYLGRAPVKPETIRFLIEPPEGVTFMDSPRISPDGKYLSFTAIDSAGVNRIWLRALNSLATQPMPGTEGARRPFWSPDSRSFAFFADGRLKKMSVAGGAAQTLCEFNGGADGTWSRDGVILFDASVNDSIMRVSASGGEPAPATSLDRSRGEVGNAWPQFLPDGRHFLFLAIGMKPGEAFLKVGELGSNKTRALVSGRISRIEYAPPGYLLYVRDRALMAQRFDARSLKLKGEPFPVVDDVSAGGGGAGNADFAVSENGVLVCRGSAGGGSSRLVWVDRSGKETGVFGSPADYGSMALSPDGLRVAVQIGPVGGNADIWILERSRGVTSRFTFDDAADLWPVWSPDGASIMFASNRAGTFGLYQKRSDGVGEDAVVTRTQQNIGPSDWSMDGRYVACLTQSGRTRWDVAVYPTFGDRKPTTFLETTFSEFDARFSPDGRWLAYSSNESGRREVYVQSYPGPGGKWQVSTEGGRDAQWRADGRELYFLSSRGQMMAVDVSAAQGLRLGIPRQLFEATVPDPDPRGRSYAVSADGQQFLLRRSMRAQDLPATSVVLHWDAGLKDR